MENQVLFEALLERCPDHVYFKDSKSRFIAASESMAENFGVESTQELIGKTDFDFFSSEHARQALDDEKTVLQTGKPVHREAEKETWPDGSITWASTIKAPIFDEEKNTVGILGISRDVTKEKEAHDEMERRDRLLQRKNEIMTADLKNARMVQGLLIPGKIRTSRIVQLAVAYEPSHGVSGDVITFPRPDEPDFRFFLGDVCGHGVSAGIYTILVKYLGDRLSREVDERPDNILTRMNEALVDVLPNRFVTAMYGVFSKSGKGVRLQISHAAHPVFFLQRKNSPLETVHISPSSGLGLVPDSSMPLITKDLPSGDRLVFFTDGLEEALNENGEEFGLDRLADLVGKSHSVPIEKVPSFLLQGIERFANAAPKMDDQSCLAFEIL